MVIILCLIYPQMLQSELFGIHSSYLFSIATCEPGLQLHLKLSPNSGDAAVLQFQMLKDPSTGSDVQTLQAGTPQGLMAYLFARFVLSCNTLILQTVK